jgi:hypothetical protein
MEKLTQWGAAKRVSKVSVPKVSVPKVNVPKVSKEQHVPPIRILVVDDSLVMRKVVTDALKTPKKALPRRPLRRFPT